MNRRLRILTHAWDPAYDEELVQLPHDLFFLPGGPRRADAEPRPGPRGVRWLPHIDAVPTDLLVLHVDQWTFHDPSQRFFFLGLRDAYAGPKVVINHGCNMVDGCSSETMRSLVRGCHMVVSSATAQRLWAIEGSTVIVPSTAAHDWRPTDYGDHNVICVQLHDTRRARHRNDAAILGAEKRVPITWVGRDLPFSSLEKYRKVLASSSIYFHPGYATPDPRARNEAMASGLAIVTTSSHGESEYIRSGENGFCSDDMDQLVDRLVHLYASPTEIRRLGRAGRETAQVVFAPRRFVADWDALFERLVPNLALGSAAV